MNFLKKAMRKRGRPQVIMTGKLRTCDAALQEIGADARQETGQWLKNKAEDSHSPFRRRERSMLRLRRMRSFQKVATDLTPVSNYFNQEPSLSCRPHFTVSRAAALAEWHGLCAA